MFELFFSFNHLGAHEGFEIPICQNCEHKIFVFEAKLAHKEPEISILRTLRNIDKFNRLMSVRKQLIFRFLK